MFTLDWVPDIPFMNRENNIQDKHLTIDKFKRITRGRQSLNSSKFVKTLKISRFNLLNRSTLKNPL